MKYLAYKIVQHAYSYHYVLVPEDKSCMYWTQIIMDVKGNQSKPDWVKQLCVFNTDSREDCFVGELTEEEAFMELL